MVQTDGATDLKGRSARDVQLRVVVVYLHFPANFWLRDGRVRAVGCGQSCWI